MRRTRRSGTRPELALRSALHRRGVRFVVDRSVPGGDRRRRADILLRGPRIAVFVDGCFWHSCPEHAHLPKTNTEWWRLKFRGIARRDRDSRLAAAGWLVVRIWEHEDPGEAAAAIEQLVGSRVVLKTEVVGDARHRSGDGGDVAVVEVDGLVEAASQRGGVAGEDVLSGDLAAFDLGDAALADAHAVGDLLLGEPAGAPDLGEAVSDDLGQKLTLAGLDRFFAADPGDVLGADVAPRDVAAHRCCSSSAARSFR